MEQWPASLTHTSLEEKIRNDCDFSSVGCCAVVLRGSGNRTIEGPSLISGLDCWTGLLGPTKTIMSAERMWLRRIKRASSCLGSMQDFCLQASQAMETRHMHIAGSPLSK